MPAALAGVGAAWAAIGTIGGVVIGTAIQGAIIGAAIGGLTAAITKGDIGKGILFGAVGGAVMGGISGAFGGGSTAGASGLTVEGANAGELARNGIVETAKTGGSWLTGGGGSKAFEFGKFFASEGGGTIGAGLLTTAGTTLAGAFDDTAEKAAELEREKMAQQDKQFYANLEAQKEIAGIQSGGGGGSDALGVARINQETQREQLAEQRRQYDTDNALKEASRRRRAGALSGLAAAKEAGQIAPTGPSIDEQAYNESTQMYAEPTAVASPIPPEERGVLG